MYALVIGASSEAIYAIKKAKERGYTVIGFDGNPEAEGLKLVDEAYVVDIRNPENVFEIIDNKNISCEKMVVLPVPLGRVLISSGAVNDRYQLVGPSRNTTEICTDKWIFDERLKKFGLRNIMCSLIEAGTTPTEPMQYPVIVKPRFGAGSRAVEKVDNSLQWDNLKRIFPTDEDFIIEDAVEGIEYGVDAMVINGVFNLVLVRKKLITPPPYRQCVGYMSLSNNADDVAISNRIADYMKKLVKAIDMENGILHADIIDDGRNPFVIEMSSRPSGHRLHDLFTPLVTGVDMVSEFLNYAESGKAVIEPRVQSEKYMIHYFDFDKAVTRIPNEQDLVEKYNLLKYECNLELGNQATVKDGHSLMGRGFFVIKADSEKELLDKADMIMKEYCD